MACAGVGMGVGVASAASPVPTSAVRGERLPREVWVATVSLEGLSADRFPQMIEAVLRRMEETLPCEPDIICLPEVFPFGTLRAGARRWTRLRRRPSARSRDRLPSLPGSTR